ncbi:DUF2975 domain-containing protein [Tuanshanicoccus lijuaniae]|uniref:DUF2975 domain-containing protein n=1 Tax=Aerococcaceae bacterium zg-1292 TaxID=2774330 RepID=UPI0019351FE4|nr:DUF2975 domain-containing protein [Aerococcaceae bacterium zg-1292]QQA37391.1 DUF2975 domain-containing protein [Aerococcaceae bacterium zg-1292]
MSQPKKFIDTQITITKVSILLFVVIVIFMLLSGTRIVNYIMPRSTPWFTGQLRYSTLLTSGYLSGSLALFFLYQLFCLISRIEHGKIFIDENVTALDWITRAIVIVSIIAVFVGGTCYLPILFVALACAFTALIIQIVRNAFAKAIQMQNELDYTI